MARTAETEEIRAEIRETRARLGQTIDELGERLNPQQLQSQITDKIRDATIGKVENMAHNVADRAKQKGGTIADTVRENPVPAAMVALGLGWMFWNGRQESSSGSNGRSWSGDTNQDRGFGGSYPAGAYPASAGFADVGAAGGSAVAWETSTTVFEAAPAYETGSARHQRQGGREGSGEGLKEKASGLTDRAKEGAGDLTGRAKEGASELTERAKEGAGQIASNVSGQTRRQARRAEEHFFSQPLAFGIATAALGVAAGLALPATHKEAELVGGARDDLVDKARDRMVETAEKAQHVVERVAEDAQSTAKDASREAGLAG